MASHSAAESPLLDLFRDAERRRIEMIERVAPSVVCLYDDNQRGGGSGVLIDPTGYGLTNYHVVANMLSTRHGWGGLNDGKLYDLEVLGIDPTGDVAMFRLIGRETFPYSDAGDSDSVRVGDTAVAMGNPFVLSEDYSPSVSLGIVTGVHRYQWGVGANLVYSDCIQTDAAINPGSSGGPLFDQEGRIIGINGRISVNRRGRYNVGFGYAISINQIRRFLPSLRAGLLVKHGTLQATVEESKDRSVRFKEIREDGAAGRVGLLVGDRLLKLDNREIVSPNELVSLLSAYPADWPVELEIERDGHRLRTGTRLDPVQPVLTTEFEPSSAVNRYAAIDAVRRFRESIMRGTNKPTPHFKQCRLTRTKIAPNPGEEEYQVKYGVGGMHLLRIKDDGSFSYAIEFSANSAVRLPTKDDAHTGSSSSEFSLSLETRHMLAALYVAQVDLPRTSLTELPPFVHKGGQAWVQEQFGTLAPVNETSSSFQPPRLLEVLELPLSDQGLARFYFDANTSRLVEVRTEHATIRAGFRVRFDDYRDIGGMDWPILMEVKGDGVEYRDSFSDWVVEPR